MNDKGCQILVITKENYVCCEVQGAVLINSYAEFHNCIKGVISQALDTIRYLVLDFSKVDIVSSTCINIITSLSPEIQAAHFDLIIINPINESRELFEVTGLKNIYQIYDDFEEFLNEKKL